MSSASASAGTSELRHAGAALALDDERRSPPFGEHDGEEQDGRGRDPGHPDADEGEQQERLPLAGEVGIEERRQAGARLDRGEGPGIERAECLPQPVQGGDEAARRSGGHPFGRDRERIGQGQQAWPRAEERREPFRR